MNQIKRVLMLGCLLGALNLTAQAQAQAAWAQFRGANGAGVSTETNLPDNIDLTKNLVWKVTLPAGHSSPVLTNDRIFLTAHEGEKRLLICVKRSDGSIEWQREISAARKQELHKSNSPTSPSAVTDGKSVYAFFHEFGLIAFSVAGKEQWRLPLGPFNNPFGMGASPILAGDTLLLNCDSESDSFFLAVNKQTGKIKWRVERPEATRGFSTPILFKPNNAAQQVLVAGALRLSAYDVATGKEIWYLRGLTWQIKPTPVLGKDRLYILGWAGGADPGQQETIPPFAEMLAKHDADKDGALNKTEVPDQKMAKAWKDFDLDRNGTLGERDWRAYQAKRSVQNGVLAFKLDPADDLHGDLTEKLLLWRYQKALPNTPSPLLYQDVLYLLKEGGIFSALNPTNGELYQQGRLTGALGDYYASPIGADGKIYALSEEGKLTVIKAGANWEILSVTDLGAPAHATPAIADGKLYVRTHQALYCLAK